MHAWVPLGGGPEGANKVILRTGWMGKVRVLIELSMQSSNLSTDKIQNEFAGVCGLSLVHDLSHNTCSLNFLSSHMVDAVLIIAIDVWVISFCIAGVAGSAAIIDDGHRPCGVCLRRCVVLLVNMPGFMRAPLHSQFTPDPPSTLIFMTINLKFMNLHTKFMKYHINCISRCYWNLGYLARYKINPSK